MQKEGIQIHTEMEASKDYCLLFERKPKDNYVKIMRKERKLHEFIFVLHYSKMKKKKCQ